MIDPNTEAVLCLAEAAKGLPPRRAGKRPHVSCLYRWTKSGCKGVVLESIQVGGTRCTSREALARFFKALTRASLPVTDRSPTQRQCDVDRVEDELAKAGI